MTKVFHHHQKSINVVNLLNPELEQQLQKKQTIILEPLQPTHKKKVNFLKRNKLIQRSKQLLKIESEACPSPMHHKTVYKLQENIKQNWESERLTPKKQSQQQFKTIFSNPKILELIQKNRRNMSSLETRKINFLSQATKNKLKRSKLSIIKRRQNSMDYIKIERDKQKIQKISLKNIKGVSYPINHAYSKYLSFYQTLYLEI